MCDNSFHLSQALDSPMDSDSMAQAHLIDGPQELKAVSEAEELEFLQKPENLSLHKVVHLTDEQLSMLFMEHWFEETCVQDKDTILCSDAIGTFSFKRDEMCRLRDSQQRCLTRQNSKLQVQADYTRNEKDTMKVGFTLATYRNPYDKSGKRAVALGIGKGAYFSCTKADGVADATPVLQLEEVCGPTALEKIKAEGELARFLFYKTDTDVQSHTTFESYKYRNWFISTSVDTKHVGMTRQSSKCTFRVENL